MSQLDDAPQGTQGSFGAARPQRTR
jgi:hypothetical protein